MKRAYRAYLMHANGMTWRAVGLAFGVSGGRARQISWRYEREVEMFFQPSERDWF